MQHKDEDIDEDVGYRIKVVWLMWHQGSGVLCDSRLQQKLKVKLYSIAIQPDMLYGAEYWPTKI
jgi:hypothetical protein